MSRRPIWTAVALSVLLTFGGSTAPLPGAPINGKTILAPNPAVDWVIARARDSIHSRLELSNEQWLAIHEILDEHAGVLWEEILAAKEARQDLVERLRAEALDTEAILQSHSEVAETELRLLLHLAVIFQEARQHLTPAQLAEVDRIVEEVWEGAELRLADLERVFADGELLGRKWRKRAGKAAAD